MIYAIVAVLVLILDQAVKYWTVSNITLEIGRVPLIDGLVHLTHVRNYGAAFSILQNTRWLLVALTVVFVAAIIYALCAELIHGAFGRWTALLLLAGAIGNGIDRLFVGYVVDMIEVEFISFPVFNIADIFVTVFGVLFCVYIVFHRASDDERATARSISRDVQTIWEHEDARHTAALEDEDDAFEDTDSSIQVPPGRSRSSTPTSPLPSGRMSRSRQKSRSRSRSCSARKPSRDDPRRGLQRARARCAGAQGPGGHHAQGAGLHTA
jgi:signal peptidase II